MTEIVTLAEVRAHLRIDHDFDDADLQLKTNAATAAVLDHIRAWAERHDSDAEKMKASPDIWRVKDAILLLVGIRDRDRDGADINLYPQGMLPYPVTALLGTLHKPVIL
ncbi:head-tail connector protein [Morganella morganii]|uniref:Phage gp6-like head-tail connector protein n=1 Tax=Morganella morganii TaxID=582 RepID=A0A2S1B897_MORMO|nr:head-tail connector protein [Morganella morganii]AWC92324.1 phage gp6-like head-tail connector protein [Morganella morganii]AWC94948.1 phage gp6-like head-tail connector protein [Morganella morganii]EKU4003934.1 phage gp6-like head-tail connector protein [Morganella morganii]MBT0408421.1 phage gp6-like head-tail connector protein [Morganella morganii subsp. morganii]RUT66348.1 hypothetical protein CKG00_08040 [Morganella morganii]